MADNDTESIYYEVVVYSDNKTPFNFVSGLIRHITGLPLYECEELARRVDRIGRHSFGPYPQPVANAMLDEANRVIADAGYTLKVETLNTRNPEKSDVISCSFCGKASTAVEKMFAGNGGSICDECVVLSAGKLQEYIPSARLRYTYQLLDWHFGDVSPDRFVKTNRNYSGRVRADLQIAINELFTSKAIRAIGIKQQYGHEKIDLSTLWTKERNAHTLAPISFEELDIGESIPAKCQLNGLWLLQEDDDRYAAILSRESDYGGGYTIFLEISGPQDERTAEITRKIFDKIEEIIRTGQSYRGKVLSLEQSPHYGGSSTGITVHKMQPVKHEEIILPARILEELERTIIRFCASRQRLRALGLQTKRGVLFYGPPGSIL